MAAGNEVAPFAGAWIEISSPFIFSSISFVAPFAGAWIEIQYDYILVLIHKLSYLLLFFDIINFW